MFIKGPEIKYVDVDLNEKHLEEALISAAKTIAKIVGMGLDYRSEIPTIRSIKKTDISSVLYLDFTDTYTHSFEIHIPKFTRGVITINGVKRYIQKQIRDTLFVRPNPSSVRVEIGNFEIFFNKKTMYVSVDKVSVPIYYLYRFAQSIYGSHSEHDELALFAEKDPLLKKQVEEIQGSRGGVTKIISSTLSRGKLTKLVKSISIIFSIYKDFLDQYVTGLDDLLYKIYLFSYNNKERETGLDLTHRIVRRPYDIMFDSFVQRLASEILYVRYLSKKRNVHKKLEVTKDLYEFVLMEQFTAPLAVISDLNRCTILGRGGFTRDNVPAKVRDLHPTQYMNLDPCVTPDRDNAGVITFLATNVELDRFGRFKDLVEREKEYLNNIFEEAKRKLISVEKQEV